MNVACGRQAREGGDSFSATWRNRPAVVYGGRMDCNSGWVDREGAGLLGNQCESCWDEGCGAGCQMFMINSGSSELPAMGGSAARTLVWLQPAVFSRIWQHRGPRVSPL